MNRIAVWVMVAVAFAFGYGFGTLGPRASAQQSDFYLIQILRELQSISRDVSSIEQCVGQHSYRGYRCEIEIEVQ